MGTPTNYLVKCRGSCGGDFVPLQVKEGRSKRFYYVHPRPRGCSHMEDFDTDITEVEDLKALHPGLTLKLKAQDVPEPAPADDPAPAPLKEETAEIPVKETGDEEGGLYGSGYFD